MGIRSYRCLENMNKTIAVYPGTFDPPTFGHLDIIRRAAKIFNKVIVAVADGQGKNPLFDINKRIKMLEKITKNIKNVEIDSFSELLVDYARRKKAGVIVRGLRVLSDFEYEFQMALTNRNIAPEIETVFLMTHESYSYLSSSLIKEIAGLGGSIKKMVPKEIEKEFRSENLY